jgi:phosphonate transport system permease protein
MDVNEITTMKANTIQNSGTADVIPPRFKPRPLWQYLLMLLLGAFFLASISGTGLTRLTLDDIAGIPGQILYVCRQMFPPSVERLEMVSRAMLQTLEMALVGNLLGIPFGFGLALLSARNLSPHPAVYYLARFMVTFLRTVPSLVWAIFLIAAVGLGPRSGTVTLVIATIGFCGRFFAEAMEEINPGPQEALTAIGAGNIGAIACTVIPEAMPSFINTALFNLEHTTRSSAVLGIVGAGGIGIELMVSIKTFHYDEAATIMIFVFAMVMGIEQLCARIRRRIMATA